MDKASPPQAFNTFNPVHHVVVALPSAEAAEAMQQDLRRAGFADADITVYAPDEMRELASAEVENATLAAKVGQEYNLARMRLELAQSGCTFVVTPARQDAKVQAVADAARRRGALRAQRYGTFIIEELTEVGEGLRQVGESPDRGLDAQTTTGQEVQAKDRPAQR